MNTWNRDILIGGKYKLRSNLGEGGFGKVYEAESGGKVYAIKRLCNLTAERVQESSSLKLLGESKAFRNIVKYIEDLDHDGYSWIVTEFLHGPTLEDHCKAHHEQQLHEDRALEYVKQIGQALTCFHENELIHRDVKPSNIIIELDKETGRRYPVLIDLGITKKRFSSDPKSSWTAKYAPIEQMCSGIAEEDFYTDVYALAATLYVLLTGTKGYEHLPDSISRRERGKVLKFPTEFNSKISPCVEYAILKGMSIEPQDRPQSIEAFLSLLQDNVLELNWAPNPLLPNELPPTQEESSQINTSITQMNSHRVILTDLPTEIGVPRNICRHDGSINSIAFTPDSTMFASASNDGYIYLWDIADGQYARAFCHPHRKLYCVTISNDNKFLIGGDSDNKIKVWDIETTELITTLSRHTSPITSVNVSLDSLTLFSSSCDGYTCVWDIKDWSFKTTLGELIPIDQRAKYHANPTLISPDGKTVISGTSYCTAKAWCIQKRTLNKTFSPSIRPALNHHITDVASIANGKFLAASTDTGIQIWNAESAKEVYCFSPRTRGGHTGRVNCLAISPHEQILASGGEDFTIKFWDLCTGKLIHTIDRHTGRGHKNEVTSIEFSPDGRFLVSGCKDNLIKIWDLPHSAASSNGVKTKIC
jgi:WD40 repeat protein